MVVQKKEMSVNKSVSLPLSQVIRISERADADGTDFSTTIARLVRLGFIYEKVLAEQSENADADYVASVKSARPIKEGAN